jgi:uncharacterized protein YdiU (UPF0061 family)
MIKELLEAMYQAKVDYTATLRALSGDTNFIVPAELEAWRSRWLARIDTERNGRPVEETLGHMRRVNPAVIARNHLVEEALQRGVEHGDFSFMRELVEALRDPYTAHATFSVAPLNDDSNYRTFCGT